MTEIMWTLSEIADRDNVTKMAVSKSIKAMRVTLPDAPVDLDVRGRVLRVSLAHYDHYRQRHVNPAKAHAGLRDSEDGGFKVLSTNGKPQSRSEDSFEEARRQAEWLKVAREKIRHQEECGQLIRVDKHQEALALVSSEIGAIVNRLPNKADALVTAISKEGLHGARQALRQIAFELRKEIADRLGVVAATAPEHDDLIEGEA